MRLRKLRWYEHVGLLLLGTLVGAVITAHIIDGPRWLVDIGGQTWAAWVQAVGSIAAIVWAVSIANAARQHSTDEREAADKKRAIERARVGWMLASEAAKTIEESALKIQNHHPGTLFQAELRRLELVVDLLQNFITGDCPAEMAADLIWLQGQIAHALEHLKGLDGLRVLPNSEVRQFRYRHERARKTAAKVRLTHFKIRATNRSRS